MDKKDLKKLLAGLSLAALVGGAGLAGSGCAVTNGNGGDEPHGTDSGEVSDETFTG
jgi:radical SAM modification target selenobiotic family peptide